MAATWWNLFLRSKRKINPVKTNSFSDPKEEVSPNGRRQSDGFFFFVKICFSPINSQIIRLENRKKNWKSRNQFFVITSFVESKNVRLVFKINLSVKANEPIHPALTFITAFKQPKYKRVQKFNNIVTFLHKTIQNKKKNFKVKSFAKLNKLFCFN
jgi:hypothetical protein